MVLFSLDPESEPESLPAAGCGVAAARGKQQRGC